MALELLWFRQLQNGQIFANQINHDRWNLLSVHVKIQWDSLQWMGWHNVAYSGATFWPETTGMLTLADHFETKLAVWLPLMHWKYPFPTSYIYILKLGETKAHTTEKRMFWSRPSFSVFRTIRKKNKKQNQPQVSSFMAKLGRRTSNPSPFSHLDSSPAAPWWWLWGLWPQRPPKATK